MTGSRVVVGVDGSPLSAAAVGHGARLASTRGLPLVVLHAFAADLPMLGFGGGADRAEVDAHAQRLLSDGVARAHAVDPALTVTTLVRDGFASQALVDASRTAFAVVVGAMGHGVLSRASVGAVAMQVVTHARCPVLVVGHEGAPAASSGGRVVVGVDGSKASLTALATAFDEAVARDASLDVVTVREPGAGDEADLEASVERALASRRAAHPDVEVRQEVVRGAPAAELADRSEGAVLLVVGHRGAGGFEGLHLGSTTLQAMARSRAPVLVVR